MFGGCSWIRTKEAEWQQIYSLPVLTTYLNTQLTAVVATKSTATPRVLYTQMVYGKTYFTLQPLTLK